MMNNENIFDTIYSIFNEVKGNMNTVKTSMNNDSQKLCLVTGANSGIGKETALSLLQSGARVIMVCRNLERAKKAEAEIQKKAKSTNTHLIIADLSLQSDIRKLAHSIHSTYSHLDVLINNAGIVQKHKTLSNEGVEITLATNHLAPFLLTELLLPLLKEAKEARIINVSSAIHKWGHIDINDIQFRTRPYRLMKAYAQSKLLMNLTTFELARRLHNTHITVNAIHPGAVKTHIGSDSANTFFLKQLDKWIKRFFLTPEKAARPIVDLALSKVHQGVNGQYFRKGKQMHASKQCYEVVLQDTIVNLSRQMVSL